MGMRRSVLYSGRGRGLHHSGMPLVCAASVTGSKQNSDSRASLVEKLTIPPGCHSLDCAGRVLDGIASSARGQIFLAVVFYFCCGTFPQRSVRLSMT